MTLGVRLGPPEPRPPEPGKAVTVLELVEGVNLAMHFALQLSALVAIGFWGL